MRQKRINSMGKEGRPASQGAVCALSAGLLMLLLVFTPVTQAQEQDQETEPTGEEPAALDRISVTGTRIRRVDVEGALPVTVIDRDMIDLSGETSVTDLIRNLSFNSFGSEPSRFQGDTGVSQVNLRALGSNRTLILVDGRRLAKAPTSTAYQNLANIPLGSVERIEILTDGASAIYGSDAIGGVINIITRKDYTGWELMYGRAEPQYGKGKREQGSAMLGTGGDRYRLLVTLSFNDRDISYVADFPGYEPAESAFANNFDVTDPNSGFPYFNFTAIPNGCEGSDAFSLVEDEYSLSGDLCVYDFARTFADETSEEVRGALIKYDLDLGKNWVLRADGTANESSGFGRFAPLAYTSIFDNLPMPLDSPNNPTNPGSPMHDPAFGPNVPVHWLHRFEAVGFRDLFRDNRLLDANVSIAGGIETLELEAGLRASRNETEELFTGLLNFALVYQFIDEGSYNLQNPAASPAEVLEQMRDSRYSEWSFDQEEAYANASWDLFETAAGPVNWVLGGEYRREHFDYWSTYVQRENSSFAAALDADRSTTSLFYEILVPLTLDLEFSLAGRYDDYSDWGSKFSPKVSLRWRASDRLTLRGSWGEGFRAPQLSINAEQPFDYVDFRNDDPQSCEAIGREPECWIIFQNHKIVSEALTAETSEQFSFGLVWDPVDWFSQTVDYYDITVENEIGQFGSDTILQLEQKGLPAPPGLGVVREPGGLINSIIGGWGNYGLMETNGVDLNTQLNFELGPGRWHGNLQWSRVFRHSFEVVGEPGPNVAGSTGAPESRATLSNTYDLADFTFAWNMHYISSQDDFWHDPEAKNHVPSWLTHDVQVNYHAPWDGRFTFGVQNITSKAPPNATGGAGFNYMLYDFYGRVYYVEYTQAFKMDHP
jgi:iron complex outermembrane receptor protein